MCCYQLYLQNVVYLVPLLNPFATTNISVDSLREESGFTSFTSLKLFLSFKVNSFSAFIKCIFNHPYKIPVPPILIFMTQDPPVANTLVAKSYAIVARVYHQ